MASLPKPVPEQPFMSLEELWAIRGTPEFDREYRRQSLALTERVRSKGGPELMDLTEEDVPGWI